MSLLQISKARPDAMSIGQMITANPSTGLSKSAGDIDKVLSRLSRPPPALSSPPPTREQSLAEKLYDALASFKVRTAAVAMHIDRDWRNRLFTQLDNLLNADNWEADDTPPTIASFSTLLRMLIYLKLRRRPGLGATSDGHIVAAWTNGGDRLTIECLPDDFVRLSLSVAIDAERERAAAVIPVGRLNQVLAPYNPARWFDNADSKCS
jgi:hypothetical protein